MPELAMSNTDQRNKGPMGEALGLGGYALPYLQSLTTPFNEQTFEIFFKALPETDWETLSTLGLLAGGAGFAVLLRRRSDQSR